MSSELELTPVFIWESLREGAVAAEMSDSPSFIPCFHSVFENGWELLPEPDLKAAFDGFHLLWAPGGESSKIPALLCHF